MLSLIAKLGYRSSTTYLHIHISVPIFVIFFSQTSDNRYFFPPCRKKKMHGRLLLYEETTKYETSEMKRFYAYVINFKAMVITNGLLQCACVGESGWSSPQLGLIAISYHNTLSLITKYGHRPSTTYLYLYQYLCQFCC